MNSDAFTQWNSSVATWKSLKNMLNKRSWHRRVHIVGFHLWEAVEKTDLIFSYIKQIWLPGARSGRN